MGKFKFVKRLDLEPFGAEAGSYLEFSPMTWREAEELRESGKDEKPLPPDATPEQQQEAAIKIAQDMMDIMKGKFLGGVVGGVPVEANDLVDIDPMALFEARKLVVPEPPSPNS